jgi:hypothetical protein
MANATGRDRKGDHGPWSMRWVVIASAMVGHGKSDGS